jgi:glycosyltransferase involved in cell wall biosynthesis
MKLSFAVTAYEETASGGPPLLECLMPAVNHSGIEEIVVVDDHSDDFDALSVMLKGIPKLKLSRNLTNLGVFGNKIAAVANTTGDWVICCDSDNVVSKEFIDVVSDQVSDEMTWYCPSFAKPTKWDGRGHGGAVHHGFDYRKYVGTYTLSNVSKLVRDKGLAQCLLNTGNQTVHRETFLKVFGRYLYERADLMMPNYLGIPESERDEPYWRNVFNACDSIIFNAEWLKSGGAMKVVRGLEYGHFWTLGSDSNFNRAPEEKTRFNELISADLLKASEQNA